LEHCRILDMATGDSLVLEMHAKAPWETAPLGALGKFAIYACMAALGATFVISMIVAILGLAFIVEERDGVVGGIACSAVGWAGMIASVLAIVRLRRRLMINWWLVKRPLARFPYHFLPACLLRNFSGPARVEFVPAGLTFTGFLGPDMLPPMGVILIAVLSLQFKIAKLLGWKGSVVYMAIALVIAAILQSRRGTSTVLVQKEDLAALRCKGPFVTVRLRRSPFAHLKAIRLFVAPTAARGFFGQFQEDFPGLLPKSYRDALDEQ